ncbi:Proteophosphoglycan ppg4, partial [Rhodotorula diobovata]
MATIEALPAVVASLGATLTSLPATLTSVNTSLLSSLFSELALDLEPALPSLGAAQQEALLSNTTWLAAQSGQLSAVAAQLPPAELRDLSHDSLLQLIKIASTRYSIMTVHAPEIWSTLLLFAIAAGTKVALCALLSSTAICRAQDVLCKRLGGEADRDLARAKLQKPARAALGHLSNLLLGTVALVMQLVAWRLFVLPSQPIQYADYAWFSLALKLVLVGYGADLLFGDVRPEIYLHHFFTFALLFVGQLAVFETKSPKFFRLAQYLILQATTEQSTYASMVAYHFYNYLRVQNHRPQLQRRLLVVTHTLLRFTRYITFPQKLVPCAFAVYWLARMWTEIDDKAWGRAWIVWCTTILSLLMILQIRFCDDTWPLAAHIGYKLHGGPLPPRQGPVMRFLARMFCCRRTRRSNV